MLTSAQVAVIRKRAADNFNSADIDALLADRDELVRRLANVETAGRLWVASLDKMRNLTTHHTDQAHIAKQFSEAEEQMRYALRAAPMTEGDER